MAKLLIPVIVVVLIIGGVFAYMKFGKSAMSPSSENKQTSNVAEQKIPVSGNPDDVAATIDKAAADEQTAVGAEANDSASVTADSAEVNSINESINENEF